MARPKKWKNRMSENLLTLLTVIGVFAGVAFGFILKNVKENKWTEREIMYIRYPGDIFLSMLSGLILPLIVASIVSAIGNLDLSLSGKIGLRSIYYYSSTTISAVALGIFLVLTIQPGRISGSVFDSDEENVLQRNVTIVDTIRPGHVSGSSFVADTTQARQRYITTTDTLLDLIRNIFPSNIVQACIQHEITYIQLCLDLSIKNTKVIDMESVDANLWLQVRTFLTLVQHAYFIIVNGIYDWKISKEYVEGTNTLGLVIFGIILGIAIAKMGEPGKPLLNFFNSLSEAMMIITSWVIWISPIGVMFLVASKLLEITNFGAIIGQLGFYFLTVLLGLILHGFGTLTIIFFVCTRKLPFTVIGQLGQVMITAFGTSSSSATLPITLQCLDHMGMDPRITRFVVPIGATINMDGTALYEAVAAIFIAQVRGIDLTFINVIAISITATAASIGAAGIPQAGLITMVMVLDTVGLPPEDVTLIIAVDWLLDRFRTTINVMCDALGAVIIEHMSKGELDAVTINHQEDNVELAQLRKHES